MAVDSSAKPYTGPLLVPAAQYAGRPAIRLHRPVYVIGSRSDARIHLVSSTVSRSHALLVQTRHETYIRDLASRTHVFINGRKVREAVLNHGDLLAIGKFTFEYQANHVSHGEEPPMLPATLQVTGAEFPIPIDERVVLIGRRQSSDIRLTEESVSTSHAVIFEWEGLRFIRDLGSRTGTFVNGQKIHEIQLNPTDAIRIGETDIVYAPSLEEAAFELINDPSDSLIADTPEAEEINLGENVQLAAAQAASVKAPVQPITFEPDVVEPATKQSLPVEQAPVEETPAKQTPVEETPVAITPIDEAGITEALAEPTQTEELPPLPLDIDQALLAPEEPDTAVAPTESIEPPPVLSVPPAPVVESKAVAEDLVSLASEDVEPEPEALAPHDTAHIPLAVAPAAEAIEPPIAPPVKPIQEKPVVAKSPLTPFDSIDIADTPDLLSTTETESTENASQAASPDAHGLELLEGSAAALSEDLPRRGWRSAVTDLTSHNDLAEEPSPQTQSISEQPPAELEIAKPEIAEPQTSDPQTAAPQIVEPELFAPQSATDDAMPFADEPASTDKPIAGNTAVIDQSALAAAEDVHAEAIDLNAADLGAPLLSATVASDESSNDLDLSDLFGSTPAAKTDDSSPIESLDMSAVDFNDPPRIVSDIAEDSLNAADQSTSPGAFPEVQSGNVSAEPPAAPSQPFDLESADFLSPAQTIADLADDATGVVDSSAAPEAFPEILPADVSSEPEAPPSQPFDPESVDFLSSAQTIADTADDATDVVDHSSEVAAEAPAAPESSPAMPVESAIGQDEVPIEIVADEFVPSDDVSEEDIPADDGESVSSFKARRQTMRDSVARSRRRKAEMAENETIDLTEPTPQSALDMPSIDDITATASPVLPLADLTAGLSDTTFGRAVQEFEGDGAGPIVEDSAAEMPLVEAPATESPADQPAVEIKGDALTTPNADSEIEPIAFTEAPAQTIAPQFDADTPEASAADEITDAEILEAAPADVPIFDAATIEESLPPDLSESEKAALERPMELATTDLAGLENELPALEDSIPSAPISEALDLSKLSAADEKMPTLDEAAALDLLLAEQPESDQPDADPHAADPSTFTGQATTDASSAVHAPPAPTASIEPEHPSTESPAADLPSDPHPAETEIDGATVDLDVWGANQTHYLGGAPLSLREGVHPPKGFGEVSVDFTQPPSSEVGASSMPPAKEAPQDPTPEEPTDILPPEAGDAIVLPAPATLSSLTATPDDSIVDSPAHLPSPDPFGADRGANGKIQIPSFGADAAQEAPAIRVDPDGPMRPRGKGRRSQVIRNGFGQNPSAPKAGGAGVIPPFADNVPGLAGMAMDALAVPPVREADVFSELPPAAEVPSAKDQIDAPRNLNEVGRAMTSDAWMKAAPLPGRSRRRPGVTPDVLSSIAADADSVTGLTGMAPAGASHPGQVRAAILLEDENTANAAAQRRRKLLRRVPILCGVMALLIGAAIACCMFFIPVRQQIQATLAFRNFDSLTHEEQLKFEVDQDRKLHQDSTRVLAIRKLQNRHPNVQPGFLLAPPAFESLKLDWPETRAGEPGLAWVNFEGTDKANDPARVQAVALAMFDVNSDMAGVAQSLKQSMDKLSSDIDAETRQNKELSDKIEYERSVQDGRPTLNELDKLKSDDATLEAAYKDAVAKATDAQAQVDQLNKAHAADAKPAAGVDPIAADAQIQQMSKDADALGAKITAAKKERAELAAKARATLDAAYDEFKKQADGAQNITKDNPQLAAYVTAAENLQQAIHQLTDEFIQKEQAEYTQLNDFKNSVVAKIQRRQADLFANDPQLKQLNDQKEMLTRQYNEAINSGLDKDAEDKKAELRLNDTATKAQKDSISTDPVYNDLLNGLTQMIDQKQKSINEDRKKTDDKLASMKSAFEKSSPTVEQLPAEQKELAAKMQERLAQIDAARKQYAEAADASAAGSDTSLQTMVDDLQTVQTNIETRKRQVAAANSEAARKARDDQFKADLAAKTAVVADLKKSVATAQAEYQTNHTNLLQRQSAAEQVAASAQRLEEDIRNQSALHTELDQHKAAWDEKKREADLAVEPLEPEDQARLVGSPIDNRMLYAGISSAGIMVAFLIAICWTVISAARESHHAYTPSFETLETPSPRKTGERRATMSGHEPEENEAAVA